MDVVSILIYLVVFAVVVWLCFWIIGEAFPAPIQQVARIVVGVLALLVLLLFLMRGGWVAAPILLRR